MKEREVESVAQKLCRKSEPSCLEAFPDICMCHLMLLQFLTARPKRRRILGDRKKKMLRDVIHRLRILDESVRLRLKTHDRMDRFVPSLTFYKVDKRWTYS